MRLSVEQVAIIRKQVDQSGIINEMLRDDVLDHLCCVVEIKLKKGNDFILALQEASHELAPEGLIEIQRETIFLLNSTKIIRMKRIMYAIGLLSAIGMTMGLTMKMLHLPGSGELSSISFLGFTLLFLPMVLIDRYKQNLHKALSERLRLIIGFLSAVLIGLSVLFKTFHYEGADIVLLVGIAFFSFGFLPFLFFGMYKKSIS